MTSIAWSWLSIPAAFAAMFAFYPALKLGTTMRTTSLVACALGIALAPLLISPDDHVSRFLATMLATCLCFKLLDLHFDAGRSLVPTPRQFLVYVMNLFLLVRRREGMEQQPTKRRNLLNLARYLAMTVLSVLIMRALMRFDWTGLPFLLEHGAKATGFFLFGISNFGLWAALYRLVGFYTIDPVDSPFKSRTVAEFWRRYNRWIGTALHEHVFKKVGGRRHPVRGTLAAFAVSGAIHEYIFAVTAGGPLGLQMTFFMLQGIAVVLTQRIHPTGIAAFGWACATWSFMIVTSLAFFASAYKLMPLYQHGPPAWLPV